MTAKMTAALSPLPERMEMGCRRDQNQHQKILKLLQKDLPGLLARMFPQYILTILCIPRFCLPRRKPGAAAL